MENFGFIIFIIALGLFAAFYAEEKKKKNKSSFFDFLAYKIVNFFKNFSLNKEGYQPPKFILEKRLMDSKEYKFYEMLKDKLGYQNYIILSKVRIEDFIGVNKELPKNEIFGLRNTIKSRHVDFLICDKETTKPLVVVEIDGRSHNRPDRIKRDQNLDKIYEKVSLPYIHVIVGEDFEKDIETIRKYLGPSFNLNK